jgi:hypothetical protein
MNKQQAVEFVEQLLSESHQCLFDLYEETDEAVYCHCGKYERDVKLRQLLNYIQGKSEYSFDFSQFVEYYTED